MYSISCFSMLSLWHSDSQSSLPQNMHSVQIFQNLFRLGKKPLQKFLFKKKTKHSSRIFQSSVLIKNWSKFSIFKAQCTIFSKTFSVLKKNAGKLFYLQKQKSKNYKKNSSHIDKRGKFSNLHFQISAYTVKMILVVILLFLSLKYRICKCNFR